MDHKRWGFLLSLWLMLFLSMSPLVYADDIPRHVDPAREHASLLINTPILEVESPDQVYPGADASISGSLTFDGEPLPGFDIIVTGFRRARWAVTGADGSFSADLSIPVDIPRGSATLRVEALPNEVYGPAIAELGLEVVRLQAELWVKAPSWIFSGDRLKVAGCVTADLQTLKDCRIVLTTGEKNVSTTSMEDGVFESQLALPLTMFTARYTYQVSASPIKPWIEPCTVSKNVLVFNVFTLVAGPIFLGIALIYTVQRFEWRPSRKRENQGEAEVEEHELEPEDPREEKLESIEDIYRKAVELVSRSPAHALPSQTIRENLTAAKSILKEPDYSLFNSLSMLYERWLYGTPTEPDLEQARSLLTELMLSHVHIIMADARINLSQAQKIE